MNNEALRKSLLKKFQEVSSDRLQKIQNAVLELDQGDPAQATGTVGRELHTMKGEARMLGLPAIGQLAHAAEDLLRSLQEKKTPAQTAADLLLRTCDCLTELVESPEAAQKGSPSSEATLRALAEASGKAVPGAPSAFSPASAAVGKPSLVPATSANRDGAVESSVPKALLNGSIRVNVEVLDGLGMLSGDLLVEGARARLGSEELKAILLRFSRVSDRFLRYGQSLRSHLDDPVLNGLETELHLLRDDAFRFVRRHVDVVNSLRGNLSQLADSVGAARLVPLSTLFEALPRAVREIAQQLGKEVQLTIDQSEAGLDRSMIEDVRDALIHLLRNAVDHGVEAPAERAKLGKSRAGRISIQARADGDMLQLEVADDGPGIDSDLLRAAAVSRGILTQERAANLTERETMELIFMPGFSTREEVTELSGRGVGMDVVKLKVEARGGSVSCYSQLRVGTRIQLRFPQSLTSMRVLLFRLGEDVYGVPAGDVEAVIRVGRADWVEVLGTVAVRHQGKPTAMAALGPLLGLNGGPRQGRPPAVVLRHGQDRAVLVVDALVNEREVAIKPCGGEFLSGAPFIAGTAALADGRIAVLLHVPDVMAEVRRLNRKEGPKEQARRLRILLVDDSPIARATESALLKALGHGVEEAQDGEEAWGKLLRERYDLVLTDVQMPRLDGLGLARRLREGDRFTQLPVIMLSSLASSEDRRRGMEAGANAYLVKGELGIQSLAQAINRLT